MPPLFSEQMDYIEQRTAPKVLVQSVKSHLEKLKGFVSQEKLKKAEVAIARINQQKLDILSDQISGVATLVSDYQNLLAAHNLVRDGKWEKAKENMDRLENFPGCGKAPIQGSIVPVCNIYQGGKLKTDEFIEISEKELRDLNKKISTQTNAVLATLE